MGGFTALTVGINQDYFVFVQTWEQRCLGKREEQRTGRAERGEEGKGRGDLLANAWVGKETSLIPGDSPTCPVAPVWASQVKGNNLVLLFNYKT